MAQIKSALHHEDYTVRLSYRKPNGFWLWGQEEKVRIRASAKGVGHAEAERVARDRFPGCIVSNVSYH